MPLLFSLCPPWNFYHMIAIKQKMIQRNVSKKREKHLHVKKRWSGNWIKKIIQIFLNGIKMEKRFVIFSLFTRNKFLSLFEWTTRVSLIRSRTQRARSEWISAYIMCARWMNESHWTIPSNVRHRALSYRHFSFIRLLLAALLKIVRCH